MAKDTNEKVAELRERLILQTLEYVDSMDAACGSPVERAMLWALLLQMNEYQGRPGALVAQNCPFVPAPGISPRVEDWSDRIDCRSQYGHHVVICGQVPVNLDGSKYRMDFGIAAWLWNVEGATPCFFDVEIDGHDFHERTKQQAERDKDRDRAFQAAGYHVARFTGSEVYRDPDAAAGKLMRFIDDVLDRTRERGR